MEQEKKFWKEYKQKQLERREERRKERAKVFLRLEADGFEVEKLTPYHYRINGVLDIFPSHGKYSDLTEERETTGSPKLRSFPSDALYEFVTDFFRQLLMRGR